MRTLTNLSLTLIHSVLALFGSREEQAIVELALRQQLTIYAQDRPRRLSPLDRTFWVVLSRLWPRWKAVAQGGVELYTGWRFQHRCQLLPGAWLFEVYHNGKILAAKELIITVAPGQQGTDGCPEP